VILAAQACSGRCRTAAALSPFRNDSGDKQIRSRVCPRVQQARALGRQLLERTAVHIKAYVVTIPETNLPDVNNHWPHGVERDEIVTR
jgi:hypothetical protein